jgi:hypothetical protein
MRTWEQLREEVLHENAEGAAAYIRLAIQENDAPALASAVSNVFAARGGLSGLDLTADEIKAALNALVDTVVSAGDVQGLLALKAATEAFITARTPRQRTSRAPKTKGKRATVRA